MKVRGGSRSSPCCGQVEKTDKNIKAYRELRSTNKTAWAMKVLQNVVTAGIRRGSTEREAAAKLVDILGNKGTQRPLAHAGTRISILLSFSVPLRHQCMCACVWLCLAPSCIGKRHLEDSIVHFVKTYKRQTVVMLPRRPFVQYYVREWGYEVEEAEQEWERAKGDQIS